jgi:hypothetical protein
MRSSIYDFYLRYFTDAVYTSKADYVAFKASLIGVGLAILYFTFR